MSITAKQLSKTFGRTPVLRGVDLHVPDGSLVALLGPSGSGKTTLLRILSGLETPDTGVVLYDDVDVTHHPAQTRGVGLVFQHYALFRHMTVFENVAFALRVRKWPQHKVRERVSELLELIKLTGFEHQRPSQLSGGQRQRVALARALAAGPTTLLLDEPFGALDTRVRKDLRQWLRQLHDTLHVTTILVTHDQQEASEVADHIVVINEGQVEQEGAPHAVLSAPRSPFVADFFDVPFEPATPISLIS